MHIPSPKSLTKLSKTSPRILRCPQGNALRTLMYSILHIAMFVTNKKRRSELLQCWLFNITYITTRDIIFHQEKLGHSTRSAPFLFASLVPAEGPTDPNSCPPPHQPLLLFLQDPPHTPPARWAGGNRTQHSLFCTIFFLKLVLFCLLQFLQ